MKRCFNVFHLFVDLLKFIWKHIILNDFEILAISNFQ